MELNTHTRVCAHTRAHTHATEHACSQGYTDSNGKYFDGGMDGFVIDLGPGHQLKIETSQYGESTFQCMEHNCMLEGPGGAAYYH